MADGVGSGVRTGTGVAVGVGAGVTMPLGGAGVAGREYAMRCSLRSVDVRCREPVGLGVQLPHQAIDLGPLGLRGLLRPMERSASRSLSISERESEDAWASDGRCFAGLAFLAAVFGAAATAGRTGADVAAAAAGAPVDAGAGRGARGAPQVLRRLLDARGSG